jgi:hypothetical protein
MKESQTVSTWIAFMGTAFSRKYKMSRMEYPVFAKKYQLIKFLYDNYELLHYYDNDYIVHDMNKYVQEQGGQFNA